MLPIAFILDGPPSYELFEQQLILCVYVPLFATLFIRVVLLQYPRRGSVAAVVCALTSAAVIILPSYRYIHFGYPYVPSVAVLVAPWIMAVLPFGALTFFLRRQAGMASETSATTRTLLSHGAVVLASLACIAITVEFADTLNTTRLRPHLPDYFAPNALMRAALLFAVSEAARQLLLRRWSFVRSAAVGTILVIAIVNAFINALSPTLALGVVSIFLAVYLANFVVSATAMHTR